MSGRCRGFSAVQRPGYIERFITLWCRSWQCEDCAPRRKAALSRLAREGQPTAFLTLTVNPRHGQNPEERARELSDAWKIVVKRAQRKFCKEKLQYLCVFEETKKGEPHLHILLRAPYIPQRWLSEQMQELIEAPIVDIRRVGHAANAARYVSKYVGKGPKPFASLKRYWTSQGWYRDPDKADRKAFNKLHPWEIVESPIWRIAECFRKRGFNMETDDATYIWVVPPDEDGL